MKAVVEPLEGNKVKLSVEVDEQEFEPALDAAFRKIARQVRVPGFRPGRTPRRLLEARLGSEVARQEALRDSLPEFYAQALRQVDVDPISPPEIDITAGEERGPVAFDAVIEVRPQVSVAGYQGLRVTVPSPAVSDEDVETQLQRLREQSGELRPVERPVRDGDHATIDVHGERSGEAAPGASVADYLYEVGSGSLVPQLDEHLRGAKVGDILTFTAEVGEEGPASFRVLVKDVKEKVLPEVSDEWAGEVSEFETMEELRADIAQRSAVFKRMQSTLALRDEAVKALAELVGEEVPDALVTAETERRLYELAERLQAQGATLQQYLEATGLSEDNLAAHLRQDATDAVRADLALRSLADAEGLEAEDGEVDAQVSRMAERLNQDPAALRRQLEERDALPTVRSDIRKAKALEWLVEHVEVVDEEGHPIDRADLLPNLEAAEPEAEKAESQA